MKSVCKAPLIAVFVLLPSAMFGAAGIVVSNATVGRNLETTGYIMLREAAPAGGVAVTLTSSDPSQVLLSKTGDAVGEPAITIQVGERVNRSPEFYIQGFSRTGSVTYTASAPGYETGTGTVTLAPSGVVLKGPDKIEMRNLAMTIATKPATISVFSVLLDSASNFVAEQAVAGGRSIHVEVTNSNPLVGKLMASSLTIANGSSSAKTQFHPAGAGNTMLSVGVPHGLSAPVQFTSLTAAVIMPGMAITDDITVGENLQHGGHLLLGAPAPAEGLVVTLTTDNPNLLISLTGADLGKQSVTIAIPPGGAGAEYSLQSLSKEGVVTYTASAPGYRSRTATVKLSPSGVLLGLYGPPDEAELFYKDVAEKEHGFTPSLSTHPEITVSLYTVQLDPVNHRAADITVQALRPGVSMTVDLKSSNPEVGSIESPVTIGGGNHGSTKFVPLKVGRTIISVATPKGFTTPGNATELTAIVTE